MFCIEINLMMIRENHGFYVTPGNIFSLVFALHHLGLNPRDDGGSNANLSTFELPYHFKCSCYVLVILCKKCDDSQITDNNKKGGRQ